MLIKHKLLIFFWWLPLIAWPQSKTYQFSHYNTLHGLSNNQVSCFLKDQQGFIWIGTAGGLNRFDGYSFRVFKHEASDPNSVDEDRILSLAPDPTGGIWVRSRKGNYFYNPLSETLEKNADMAAARVGLPDADFTHLEITRSGDYLLQHNRYGLVKYLVRTKRLIRIPMPDGIQGNEDKNLSDFKEDSKGNIWLVYKTGKLARLDLPNYQLGWQSKRLDVQEKSSVYAYRIVLDGQDEPWIFVPGTKKGVYYFNTAKDQLISVNTESHVFKLSNDLVTSMILGPEGKIWIGTDHGGINIVDKDRQKISYLLHNPHDASTISENSIYSLYKDSGGIVWVGTFKQGFSSYDPSINRFPLVRHSSQDKASLPFNDVNAFEQDKNGNLWIGTNGGGLIYFNRKENTFKQFKNDPKNPSSLSSNVIVSLLTDSSGLLWIGTYMGGLNCFDGKTFTRYNHQPDVSSSLSDDNVWAIHQDNSGRIWIGTLSKGLDRFDPDTQSFHHYPPRAPNSVVADYVSCILEDRLGNLWFGTAYGLDVLERKTGRFRHYGTIQDNRQTLRGDIVNAIIEDGLGNIWVGTNNALNLFDRAKGSFTSFDTKDGLPDNAILSIAADQRQNLWMGTQNGLAYMQVGARKDGRPVKVSFRVYNEEDGLQGRSFNERAAFRLRTGELVFGGANGFNIFFADSSRKETSSPPLVLTDFQIFNNSILPGELLDGHTILRKSIPETSEIVLEHKQNVFTIGFAALGIVKSQRHGYLYKLEGFDGRWYVADDDQRKVTYTNLDPGQYLFRIKLSAPIHGGSARERQLRVTILPPVWKSPSAYVAYIVLILIAGWLIYWALLDKQRMRYEIARQREAAEQSRQLDQMKMNFFSNVSHEFRTPLTLILAPLEALLKNKQLDEVVQKQHTLIQKNATRLLNLVNQLLDLKSIAIDTTKFSPARGEIVGFVREITSSFSGLSEKQKTKIQFQSSMAFCYTEFDPEKLSSILYNLFSNAFKFTKENGQVVVALDFEILEGKEHIRISVTDTGIGIPKDARQKIFSRFYQHNLPNGMINQGSGIGLALVWEFVKMHQGTVQVESREGVGSSFVLRLPVVVAQAEPASESQPLENVHRERQQQQQASPSLLLVEDNEEFRDYLRLTLEADYAVHQASNGKQALEMTLEFIPDIIISDVVMPVMDGTELCRLLKADPRISHIPLILLTANAEDQQQLYGYEVGANVYIKKPFRLDILKAVIVNLIKQRQTQQQEFQSQIQIPISELDLASPDQKFIRKAAMMVENHISEPGFNVEELSEAMEMSRFYLYKKIVSLTGKTPLEFIRIIRLRQASALLKENHYTISEVAYQCGFNNPKYFTKLFKEEFGVLPSDFKREGARKMNLF